MINKIFTFIFLFITQASFSQTWSDDIAEIFYDKCSKCHHNGGVAPFPLITYAETSPLATAIYVFPVPAGPIAKVIFLFISKSK